MLRRLFLWSSQNAWLSEQVPRFSMARRAVARFMPGEDLEAALAAAGELRASGIATVLTNLGENVADLDEAANVGCHYGQVLERVAELGQNAEISIKLTHLGLDLGDDVAYRHLVALVERAWGLGNYVWVDMEGSDYTHVTLDLVRRCRTEHRNVGVCLQAYLYRTTRDLDGLLPLGAGVRLVKGAYDEPASLAYPKKKDVDRSYLELTQRLLEEGPRYGARVAFGTHDARLIDRIREAASAQGNGRDGFEFQLLYGIQPNLQQRLAADGYRVRVLISYGEAWFAWYMRRLAERPANVLFAARALVSAGR